MLIEEHLTRLFKAHAALAQVRGVPLKGLAVENITDLHHNKCIYVVDWGLDRIGRGSRFWFAGVGSGGKVGDKQDSADPRPAFLPRDE